MMRFNSDKTVLHDRRRVSHRAGLFRMRERFAYRSNGPASGYTQAQNDAAQAAVLAFAQPMIQQVYVNSTYAASNTAQGQVLNIPLNNVGLNTRLTIEVTGTIAQVAAETLNKTQFGLANFFSNVRLVDLSNLERVNTYGAHLHMLASLRRQNVYGASYVNDSPMNFGSTFSVNSQPTGVTAAQNFRMFFEVPLAYHEYDLRGAVYAAVTSAQWRLQLTINNTMVVGSATNPLFAAWQSSTAGNLGTLTNVVIKVFQHYLDQLPRASDGSAAVPLMSLAYNYLINSTAPTGMAANADFPVQYSNFRTFLSTIAVFDNPSVAGGAIGIGADVAYLGIQAANLVFLQQFDPFMAALQARDKIGDDMPRGTYLFDHRRKPIITNQYGNIQFVLNASTVNTGAVLYMLYEMLAVQSQAINAGSLAGP